MQRVRPFQRAKFGILIKYLETYKTPDYRMTIENGMRQAFIYNKAAIDALDSMSKQNATDHATSVAQHDLFQYLFSVAMKDGKVDPSYDKFKKVNSTFQAVKKFDDGNDGLSTPLDLTEYFPDLMVYCDWSRFDEGVSCAGKKDANIACDQDLKQDVVMGPLYKSCKTGKQEAPMVRNFPFEDITYLTFSSYLDIYTAHTCRKRPQQWQARPDPNVLRVSQAITHTPAEILGKCSNWVHI